MAKMIGEEDEVEIEPSLKGCYRSFKELCLAASRELQGEEELEKAYESCLKISSSDVSQSPRKIFFLGGGDSVYSYQGVPSFSEMIEVPLDNPYLNVLQEGDNSYQHGEIYSPNLAWFQQQAQQFAIWAGPKELAGDVIYYEPLQS